MLAGFLTLAGTLLAILFWQMKRSAAKADDPKTQNEKRYKQIDADIAAGKSLPATVHASADLDELERLQRGESNQRGSS